MGSGWNSGLRFVDGRHVRGSKSLQRLRPSWAPRPGPKTLEQRTRYPADRVKVVEELDVESLPTGRISRLVVNLSHDGLGRTLGVPVLVARGAKPGLTMGVTAALHGNEVNGIPVIHELFNKLDPKELRGTLVAVVVTNTPGFLLNQRAFIDGQDLNHIFPGRADGTESQVYTWRLIDRIVSRVDRLVDLHTASFGRINSLYVRADLSDEYTARMAYLLRPQIVLHNPPSDFTMRGHVMELGKPAITVEIGDPQRFQPEFIRSTVRGIRRILADAGMVAKRPFKPGAAPVICESSRWIYTEHGGLLSVTPKLTEEIAEGELVAHVTDVFGEHIADYRAPHAGVVIGKSTNPVAQTGARILHLGRVAQPGDPRFKSRATLGLGTPEEVAVDSRPSEPS